MTDTRRKQLEARRAQLSAARNARRDLDKCLQVAHRAVFTAPEIDRVKALRSCEVR